MKTPYPTNNAVITGAVCALPSPLTSLLAGLFVVLAGCANWHGQTYRGLLEEANWQSTLVSAGPFTLSVFAPAELSPNADLSVYIGGDGLAFRSRYGVSRNPTGTAHLALRLALSDPATSLFLARPCYYIELPRAQCQPQLWSTHRYADEVVQGMVIALGNIMKDRPHSRLTLVGYSGGGVLAMLIARRMDRVSRVVTIAAPLDTDAWTALHGYSALSQGSNPAEFKDWPARLQQVHLNAGEDENVPPQITDSFLSKTTSGNVAVLTKTFPTFDHECCWLREWQGILAGVRDHASR